MWEERFLGLASDSERDIRRGVRESYKCRRGGRALVDIPRSCWGICDWVVNDMWGEVVGATGVQMGDEQIRRWCGPQMVVDRGWALMKWRMFWLRVGVVNNGRP